MLICSYRILWLKRLAFLDLGLYGLSLKSTRLDVINIGLLQTECFPHKYMTSWTAAFIVSESVNLWYWSYFSNLDEILFHQIYSQTHEVSFSYNILALEQSQSKPYIMKVHTEIAPWEPRNHWNNKRECA